MESLYAPTGRARRGNRGDGDAADRGAPQAGGDQYLGSFHDYLFCLLARREAEVIILGLPATHPTTRPGPATTAAN